MHRLALVLGLLCFGAVLHAAEPAIALLGSDGKMHKPLNVPAGKKGVVLVFVSPYCNTSSTFLPELNAITEAYEDRFNFFLIHAEPGLKLAQVLEHKILFNVRAHALLDSEQVLVQRTGARITPEVVVLSPKAEPLYQGRINDLYLGPTRRQRQATTSELRDALGAIAQGQPVPTARTEAVGCKITPVK